MLFKCTSFAAALALLAAGLVGIAEAQKKAPAAPDKTTATSDKASQGVWHRASGIQGMTIINDKEKELGSVSDVVIDVRRGQVKYAALSYGGFLGVGDKLFAVPWQAFRHIHNKEEGIHKLVLNLDEATLKSAPGFDQNDWPNFADAKIAKELEMYYKTPSKDPSKSGAAAAKDRPADKTADSKQQDVVHRSDELLGMTVKDADGKEIASINDLVIDMDTGKVRYAAVSYGGLFGLGDKLFAIPWSTFQCKYDQSEEAYYVVLPVDEVTLRKAPGFDQNNWPNLANPKFGEEIDKYYGTSKSKTKTQSNR